jgi:N-acetylglucosamine-6-phosphate deacetylase
VLPAIGHSNAEYDEVVEALDAGFTHITHLYSCCSTVHRRNAYRYAGIVEAAYLLDGLTVEIIADGVHLPPPLLQQVYRFIGPDRTALVTDSMRGAGMPDGESIIGSREGGLRVILEDGVAKLPDRTAFAGSVATMDRLVKNMVNLAKATLTDAVKMATETPARIVGLTDRGTLDEGKRADIVLFNDEFCVSRTIVGGRTVYCKE